MKRLVSLLMGLALILSLSATVFADVIWIPQNTFLEQNMNQCSRTDREYQTVTDVPVYESPESDRVLWTLDQGKDIWIYYTYTDAEGNRWGNCESDDFSQSGWIPLAYTSLVYDYLSFEEDYGHMFREVGKTLTPDLADEDQTIYFWEYPGSPNGFVYPFTETDISIPYSLAYTDPQGREWGFISYHRGIRNMWVCVSDPSADFTDLYPDGAPQVPVTEPEETDPTLPSEPIVPLTPSSAGSLRMGTGVAVVLCVVVSVVILVKMRKKKNS